MAEISTKPYLIRAIYEWCTDNGFTPYLAVAVDERTRVPVEHVKAGEIVLNVSSVATNRLTIGNELIEFQARFGGIARDLSIPVANVTAIYAKESGHGMAFEVPKAPAIVPAAGSKPRAVEGGAAAAAGDATAGGEADAADAAAARADPNGAPVPVDAGAGASPDPQKP
ncbi:MAG TPA: ClpXP protease specificity-enhancing factor, partial [Burkholderiaceae bacterium]|nr:ClpXP protease specificity-enhancing factor [Burkholderiaceae bacterium]